MVVVVGWGGGFGGGARAMGRVAMRIAAGERRDGRRCFAGCGCGVVGWRDRGGWGWRGGCGLLMERVWC